MKSCIVFLMVLPYLLFADSVNGWKPLHEAVYRNDFKLLKKIVEKDKCDVDSQSKAGISALHIAVKTRNLKMVNYLLDHGVDVDIQDKNGYTPLHYAISARRLKIVRALIMHDADVNLANNAGITPLQQAAYSNDFSIVDFLLDHGADPKVLNANGINACELAYLKGNISMAHHLLFYTNGKCGEYVDELNNISNGGDR